ncbi:hypothetical protein EC973_004080 [Apophysomyces ossiformis]|uniref:MATH domain-containing protein n=1 Tax=Apophysomyces ossiformis TaxID=679940 RepID=A0A8H7EKS1_9FUNG|nr:hypothetical protein EC973_004080 [Apophysomyces ossiformis]
MELAEQRRTLDILRHIQDVMGRRFNEVEKRISQKPVNEQTYKIIMILIEDLMKESNEHMDYIKTSSSIIEQDKELIIAKFAEFKSKLLQCQNEYNLHTRDIKLKQLQDKLNLKSEKCRQLEAKLSGLEKRWLEKENGQQDILLTVPLMIQARISESADKVCCFPFDKGYTCYKQLCKKIQENFGLEHFSITMKRHNLSCQYDMELTEEKYRNAIESIINGNDSDATFHVMEINIETSTEELQSSGTLSNFGVDNVEETSPEQSDGASDGFSDLGDMEFPLVSVDTEARLEGPKKENPMHPLDTIARELLPPSRREEVDFCIYHWTVWNWSQLEGEVNSEEFDAGGFEWKLEVNPKINTDDKHNMSLYLCLAETNPQLLVHAEFVLMASNPSDPNMRYSCPSNYLLRH